jgi:hypothetical protein
MTKVPLKEAVANAMEFAKAVLEPGRTKDLRLEEVEWEFRNDGEVWLITLSMARPRLVMDEAVNPLSSGILSIGPRDYKTFTVRCETGEVISMKIRELAHAE